MPVVVILDSLSYYEQERKALHLIGALLGRTVNPRIKPRKPLVIFIEGQFREAMKITKGFQNMGTDVKLLFKQLESYSALRAISTRIPHHPLVVAVISGKRFLLHALAVGAFIPAPLRSGNYVRTSLRIPTLHYACIPASTSAPRGISILFLTPYIPFLQSYPCHFPMLFSPLLMERGQG
jgi:hypothetical protein